MSAMRLVTAVTASFMLSVSGAAMAAGDHAGGHGQPQQKNQGHHGGGHGDGHHGDGHGGGHHRANIGKPGEASEVDRTIEVVMKDNYYEPESISIEKGETIRFKVRNEGSLVHEFNIATHKMHMNHQDEMMSMVKQGIIEGGQLHHDMMKEHGMMHDHANSALLEPGQSKEIIWHFGAKTDLEFACNVPGHYQAGMMGNIHIQ